VYPDRIGNGKHGRPVRSKDSSCAEQDLHADGTPGSGASLPLDRLCGIYFRNNNNLCLPGFVAATNRGAKTMTWETPTFVEVKMDAEINSYQDDFGGDREPGV
jgi:hypothetical protein